MPSLSIPSSLPKPQISHLINQQRIAQGIHILWPDHQLQKFMASSKYADGNYSLQSITENGSMRKLDRVVIQADVELEISIYNKLISKLFTNICIFSGLGATILKQPILDFHYSTLNQGKAQSVNNKDQEDSSEQEKKDKIVIFLSERPIVLDQVKSFRQNWNFIAYQLSKSIYLWGIALHPLNQSTYKIISHQNITRNGACLQADIEKNNKIYVQLLLLGCKWRPQYRQKPSQRRKSRNHQKAIEQSFDDIFVVYSMQFKFFDSILSSLDGRFKFEEFSQGRASERFSGMRRFKKFEQKVKQTEKKVYERSEEQKQEIDKNIKKVRVQQPQEKNSELWHKDNESKGIRIQMIECMFSVKKKATQDKQNLWMVERLENIKLQPITVENKQNHEQSIVQIYLSNITTSSKQQCLEICSKYLSSSCRLFDPENYDSSKKNFIVIQKNFFKNGYYSDFTLQVIKELIQLLHQRSSQQQNTLDIRKWFFRIEKQCIRNEDRVRAYLDLVYVLGSLEFIYDNIMQILFLKIVEYIRRQSTKDDQKIDFEEQISEMNESMKRLSLDSESQWVSVWFQCNHHLAQIEEKQKYVQVYQNLREILMRNSISILQSELCDIYLPSIIIESESDTGIDYSNALIESIQYLNSLSQEYLENLNLIGSWYINIKGLQNWTDILNSISPLFWQQVCIPKRGIHILDAIKKKQKVQQKQYACCFKLLEHIPFIQREFKQSEDVLDSTNYISFDYSINTRPQLILNQQIVLPTIAISSIQFQPIISFFSSNSFLKAQIFMRPLTNSQKLKFHSFSVVTVCIIPTLSFSHSDRKQITFYSSSRNHILTQIWQSQIRDIQCLDQLRQGLEVNIKILIQNNFLHDLCLALLKEQLENTMKIKYQKKNKTVLGVRKSLNNTTQRLSIFSNHPCNITEKYIYTEECFYHTSCQKCEPPSFDTENIEKDEAQYPFSLYSVSEAQLANILKINELQVSDESALLMFVCLYYQNKKKRYKNQSIKGQLFLHLRYKEISISNILGLALHKPHLQNISIFIELVQQVIYKYSGIKPKKTLLNSFKFEGRAKTAKIVSSISQSDRRQDETDNENIYQILEEFMKSQIGQKIYAGNY